MMSENDFSLVCSKIDNEKEFLNSVSQEIWGKPEIGNEEVHAHDTLTNALSRCDFNVQKQYFLPTAFKAEYSSKLEKGPVIAVLLEYDALPDIGHACGHNLIAEAGLAASIGIKAAMEADPALAGKLLVLGTPAEERTGEKVQLLKKGAFVDVDAAMMVHPFHLNMFFPPFPNCRLINAEFHGKESHAGLYPWKGYNALDAAVAAYQNIAMLRQQTRPACRISVIITKGGTVVNGIPEESRLEISIRTATNEEMKDLLSRVRSCLESGAKAAGCSVSIESNDDRFFQNLLTNKVMGDLFQTYTEKLGMNPSDLSKMEEMGGCSDMGNVSHVVPSIHPMYGINTEAANHTKEFTEATGSPHAQQPTLLVAKAMAMTALKLMRCPKTLEEVKKQFEADIAK